MFNTRKYFNKSIQLFNSWMHLTSVPIPQSQHHSNWLVFKWTGPKLYLSILPTFQVFGSCPTSDMTEKFGDILQFCSHVSRLMVGEIRRRASNQSTGLSLFPTLCWQFVREGLTKKKFWRTLSSSIASAISCTPSQTWGCPPPNNTDENVQTELKTQILPVSSYWKTGYLAWTRISQCVWGYLRFVNFPYIIPWILSSSSLFPQNHYWIYRNSQRK